MKIKRIPEYKISPAEHEKIIQLLKSCFPEYPGHRDYYKQIPSFRYLISKNKQLIGHLAVEHRKIKIGGDVASIFGISDLCISKNFQSMKLGSKLIKELESLGKAHQIDFIILTTNDHSIYQNNGFFVVNNTCRWLMINEHQTFGVNHKHINSSLMVKEISELKWNNGLVDFLGHIF